MLWNFHHLDLCTDGSFLQSLVTGSSWLLLSAYPPAIRAYAARPAQRRDRTRQSFPPMTTQVEEENSCVLGIAHPMLRRLLLLFWSKDVWNNGWRFVDGRVQMKQTIKLLGKRKYMMINLQTNVEGRGGALSSPQGFPCSMPHDKVQYCDNTAICHCNFDVLHDVRLI